MPAPSETNLWSAGLPLRGSRPLSDEERADLEARRSRFQRQGLAALLGVPCAFLLFFLLAPLTPHPSAAALALPLILLTVATPLLALTARDCLLLARDLRRDLADGRADRFEGPIGATAVDGTLRRLVRAGLLEKGGSDPQWFEVLPASGLVWHANGGRPRQWIRAAYAETANLPTYAGIAAEWVESVDNTREDAFHVGRRDLSEAETAELRRHQRRIVTRPVALGLLLNAALAATLWALYAGMVREPHHLFLFAVLFAATLQVSVSMVKCIVLGVKLARDLRVRIAVIVRTPSLLPQPDGSSALLAPDEFLGCSGVLWTRSGRPAPWRLLPAW